MRYSTLTNNFCVDLLSSHVPHFSIDFNRSICWKSWLSLILKFLQEFRQWELSNRSHLWKLSIFLWEFQWQYIMRADASQPKKFPEAAVRRRFSKRVFLKMSQHLQENNCLEVCFNKIADVKVCNFTKKRLQHRCLPVNIATFLSTLFL